MMNLVGIVVFLNGFIHLMKFQKLPNSSFRNDGIVIEKSQKKSINYSILSFKLLMFYTIIKKINK